MKLDVEALAREAQVGDSHGHFIRHYLPELEAFARLIVERCALEAENEAKHPWGYGYESPDWAKGTDDAAQAIRQLLEDK